MRILGKNRLQTQPGEVVEINGILFAGEMFVLFSESAIGTELKILRREDGVITLQELRRDDEQTDL